jgi:hypothetical protein
MCYDGTAFELLNRHPPQLTAAATYYINPVIGSDTLYDGIAATASGPHGRMGDAQSRL